MILQFNLIFMQIDINEGRSRAFNIFLRFMQLAASMIVAIETAKLDNQDCDPQFYKLIEIASIALLIISIVANLFFRCSSGFNKTFFFILLSVCAIISGIALIVSFAGYGADGVCASNKVTYKFIVIEIITIVILNLLILFVSFFWIQRYTNSPGNIVWVFMFFGADWNHAYKSALIILGVASLAICLVTLTINIVAGLYGITSGVKKGVVGCWAVCLIVMFADQILAIAAYMQNSDYGEYNDKMAKKLLLIFVIVNIIEFLLWLFGLLTLQYENGDKIRDDMLAFGESPRVDEQAWGEDVGGGIGTLK